MDYNKRTSHNNGQHVKVGDDKRRISEGYRGVTAPSRSGRFGYTPIYKPTNPDIPILTSAMPSGGDGKKGNP